MKNKFGLVLVIGALFLIVAGCSLDSITGGGGESGDSSSKSEDAKKGSDSSKSSSSSGDVLNSGIPECDELAQYVEDNSEKIEGSIVGKAIMLMYKNTILKAIEEGAKDMDDEQKKKMGETCAKTLKELKESQE
ncbi:MAG: hypothetical protein OEM82_07080 [Acidobacteriota bacterium]|nr:hypothetical protein [Acidobacteriota bacterium]MDH3530149.1 hypothetical protein [Acidobacteriota bacterium]